jgi:hypothetical protein
MDIIASALIDRLKKTEKKGKEENKTMRDEKSHTWGQRTRCKEG